jgi:hypothetical protein
MQVQAKPQQQGTTRLAAELYECCVPQGQLCGCYHITILLGVQQHELLTPLSALVHGFNSLPTAAQAGCKLGFGWAPLADMQVHRKPYWSLVQLLLLTKQGTKHRHTQYLGYCSCIEAMRLALRAPEARLRCVEAGSGLRLKRCLTKSFKAALTRWPQRRARLAELGFELGERVVLPCQPPPAA